jgi:hypothetical protein
MASLTGDSLYCVELPFPAGLPDNKLSFLPFLYLSIIWYTVPYYTKGAPSTL